MIVQHSVPQGPRHSIEIGQATWDPSQNSIRNRYDQANGRFSVRASSELPLADLEPIMREVAQRDLLTPSALARIMQELAASIQRQATAAGI